MKEILLTVSTKGQVTIPAEVRKRLGVEKNGRIVMVVDEKGGDIKLRRPRYPDLESVRGAAGKLPKKMSWDEMIEIAHEDAFNKKT